MLYSFTILSWNNNPDECFVLEASDLLDAHMKAIDWVARLEEALKTIPTRSPEARETMITSVQLADDTMMANDESIATYVDNIKSMIEFFKNHHEED